MCGFSVVLLGSLEEKLKFSFNIYDIDGNGFILWNEMFVIFFVCSLNNGNEGFIYFVVLILLFIEVLLVF